LPNVVGGPAFVVPKKKIDGDPLSEKHSAAKAKLITIQLKAIDHLSFTRMNPQTLSGAAN
jgi:hypothetical protein